MAISAADRAMAAEHLNSQYKTLAAEVGQESLSDNGAGWKQDLDQAEGRMGGGGHRMAYHALARYYALSRFAGLLASRVDTNAYAMEGDRAAIFEHVGELRESEAASCAGYGYPVTVEDATSGTVGWMVLPDSDIVGTPPSTSPALSGGLTHDRYTMNTIATTEEWE